MGEWWPTIVALIFGLLSIPISYAYTMVCESLSPASMLVLAGGIMTAVLAITVMLTYGKVKNKMYYGFALFVFSGIIDIISGLEMDGIVNGFLTFYLKYGEPYLMSAWGAMASYWDGTVNLICYLVMAYLSSNGLSFRTIGLHWSSSILNSMIVLLLGACLSECGMSWCTLLNIPYVLFPVAVAVHCLRQPSHPQYGKPSWIDKALIVLLIEAALAALLKGLAAIQSNQAIPAWYRTMAEPLLQEEKPAPFAAIQGIIALFYFLPAFIAVAWGISVNPAQIWVRDLTVILAGATLQAGGSTIGMVFHRLTKPSHRLPPLKNHLAFCAFWAVNLLLSLVPQIVAIRLLWFPISKKAATGTQLEKPREVKNKKKKPQKVKEQ